MKKILLLLIILPLTAILVTETVRLFSRAGPIVADIDVNLLESRGVLPRPWEGLAQGGEQDSDGKMLLLGPTVKKLAAIQTRYLRLDHVFDQESEARIKEIVKSGATPFISLSYFPEGAADSLVGNVSNWAKWETAVTGMVERVSGKTGMNINNVYYEVWNEPDGENFGNFSVGQGKDYFDLYRRTVEAAARASDVNDYRIGGPALADPRRCVNGRLFSCQEFWLDRFLKLVGDNNTRLDFISWHRYSKSPKDFVDDAYFIGTLSYKYPAIQKVEKVITEWGSDPARGAIHQTVFDAAHLVAMARQVLGVVTLATRFEVRDGPNQEKDGWGIMRYDGSPKPTFAALELLDKLKTERVNINGEGSFVTGIASQDLTGFTLLLSNYDSVSKNTEKVPIKISKAISGKYKITKTTINSRTPLGATTIEEAEIVGGEYKAAELMLPNSVVLWDFELITT